METCNKAQIILFRSQCKIVDYKASCRSCLLLVSFEPKHGTTQQAPLEYVNIYSGFSQSVAASECLTMKLQVQ